jgi:hypothetical protein
MVASILQLVTNVDTSKPKKKKEGTKEGPWHP